MQNNTMNHDPLNMDNTMEQSATPADHSAPAPAKRTAPSSILTLNADTEVETLESKEDVLWHELQNAYRTRKTNFPLCPPRCMICCAASASVIG